MRRTAVTVLLTHAMFIGATTAAASDLWIHIRAEDRVGSSRPERVTVNIPFSVVEKVAPLIPERAVREARVEIGGGRFDAGDVRALIDEVRRSPENDVVTVQEEGGTLRAHWAGAEFVLEIEEQAGRKERTELRLPLDLVDALASGETLDPRAMVEALARRGAGEILVARENGSHVRIWIDRSPEAGRGNEP